MFAGLVQAKAEAAIRAVGLADFLSIPKKSSASGGIVAANADQKHELQPQGHRSAAGGAADGDPLVREPVRQHRRCIVQYVIEGALGACATAVGSTIRCLHPANPSAR